MKRNAFQLLLQGSKKKGGQAKSEETEGGAKKKQRHAYVECPICGRRWDTAIYHVIKGRH